MNSGSLEVLDHGKTDKEMRDKWQAKKQKMNTIKKVNLEIQYKVHNSLKTTILSSWLPS